MYDFDGKAFHSFTRGFDKPFDENLIRIMQNTTKMLCENIQGCVFGYTQSDEITLVLVDYRNIESSAWFDNQVQKMVSVSASMASNFFNQSLGLEITKCGNKDKRAMLINKMFKATFDARAFNLPMHEVINNVIWRQQDATRNSINSLAQSLFSHKELQGLNCKTVQIKMLTEKNVNWNNLTIPEKRGTAVLKDEEGKWYIDYEMPILVENRDYINKLVIFE